MSDKRYSLLATRYSPRALVYLPPHAWFWYTTTMSDYRKLRVWQAARSLAHDCYRSTAGFPPSERYGLQSQIRRAAMSVPANLAEGSGRGSDRDFARFVHIARGSASELQSLINSACEVGLLKADVAAELDRQVAVVGKMLSGLARRLATSS